MSRLKFVTSSGEELSKEKLKEACKMLEDKKTKKSICEFLNIAYNTTRLTKLLEEFTSQEEYVKTMRRKLRGTPVSTLEARDILEGYLSGEALNSLSERTYRSVDSIKAVLNKYSIPLRDSSHSYQNPAISENNTKEEYNENDLVYSLRYLEVATICKRVKDSFSMPVYRIRTLGSYSRFAHQPYYELVDLTQVQKELELRLDNIKPELSVTNED